MRYKGYIKQQNNYNSQSNVEKNKKTHKPNAEFLENCNNNYKLVMG